MLPGVWRKQPSRYGSAGAYEGNHTPFYGQWQLLHQFSKNFSILYQQTKGGNIYSPLYVHKVQFLRPRQLSEAEKFNIRFPTPDLLTNTADRLRYYRYKKALLQREVADHAGLDRTTYSAYEESLREKYDLHKLEKIATLFDIHITDLLDEYNYFLYRGQGPQVRSIRKSLKLTQRNMGILLGVTASAVKAYESERICMFRSTYEKLIALSQENERSA